MRSAASDVFDGVTPPVRGAPPGRFTSSFLLSLFITYISILSSGAGRLSSLSTLYSLLMSNKIFI